VRTWIVATSGSASKRSIVGSSSASSRMTVLWQATPQRLALATGGEWVQAVALTIRAAHTNVVEMGGVDATHE
jgi:hypothetical protein